MKNGLKKRRVSSRRHPYNQQTFFTGDFVGSNDGTFGSANGGSLGFVNATPSTLGSPMNAGMLSGGYLHQNY
jgi:hypothetical protein